MYYRSSCIQNNIVTERDWYVNTKIILWWEQNGFQKEVLVC